jgi:hypothetical protein
MRRASNALAAQLLTNISHMMRLKEDHEGGKHLSGIGEG